MNKLKFLDRKGRPFLTNRFLLVSLIVVATFAMGFPFPILMKVGTFLFIGLLLAILIDFFLLYLTKKTIGVQRIVDEKLSNGDENKIVYQLEGRFTFKPILEIYDEYPAQLQLRNAFIDYSPINKKFKQSLAYIIYPKTRGEYKFGNIKLLSKSFIGLLSKLITIDAETTVKVVPSIIQFKKFSFLAHTNRLEEIGVKKVRKVGSSTEFDQIKEFQRGDNVKRINWKASARRNQIMVNHYDDEKAQNIYFLIDKGRMMHSPFNGLTLFDYAINSTLSLSGVAKHKGDKIGMITFSDVIGSWVPAKSNGNQIHKINEELYHQNIRQKETDYSRLYKNLRMRLRGRSMLIMFTNFDSIVSLNRQLKYLKAISKNHLLIVVSFENKEIKDIANSKTSGEREYFDQSIAEKFLQEKQQIITEMNLAGIYTISTTPENLTINSINKYLEIKSRGLL